MAASSAQTNFGDLNRSAWLSTAWRLSMRRILNRAISQPKERLLVREEFARATNQMLSDAVDLRAARGIKKVQML
jgi:hypothetical protein